jgi:ATP-binding cassette subfamily F protein 3
MSLLSLFEVSFRYVSGLQLFDGATFSINPGDRIAIVGANGCGKSTLLKLLSGRLSPTSGKISLRGGLTIAVADQEAAKEDNTTLFDYAFEAQPFLAQLRRSLHETEASVVDASGAISYAQNVAEYESAGGYAAEIGIKQTLLGLGFTEAELTLPLDKLSGGQRTRAATARALSQTTDLVLLDEPTNNLDIDAREWLEQQLSSRAGTSVVISHDRWLLRAFATRIVDIERGKVSLFEGSYDEYRIRRAMLLRQAWADYEAFQRRKAAANQAAQRRNQLADHMTIAPSGERHFKDHYARKAGKVDRTARILRQRHTHEPKVEKPWEEQDIGHLSFDRVKRSGDIPVMVTAITKSCGSKTLFSNLSFQLRRGERIAIIGPNGSGKTTLLKILLCAEQPDQGEVRFGSNLQIGWFSQEAAGLDLDKSSLELCGSDTHARTLLGCLKVRPDCINRAARELSGGERTKVVLASLLCNGANLLLLDEPTNHLEIEAQEALEQALAVFPGSLIVVSHDRAFLEALGPDLRLLRLDEFAFQVSLPR